MLEQLQLQTDVMPLAFILCDASYRTTYWNPAAEQIFGYKSSEMIGLPSHKLLVVEESQGFVEEIFRKIAGGEILSSSFSDNVTKDGRNIVCEWYAAPLTKPDGTFIGIMSMAQDVTEQRRAESERRSQAEQLRQAQKMEVVGQLAGGIAHDFNNLLTAINGYSDLSLRGIQPDTSLYRNLQEVKKAGLRAASLTSQLLAFSRKQVMQPKVLDLNEVVADMDKMLRRLIGEHIDLVTLTTSDLGAVKADPGQIEQLVLNLSLNARDAMPDGGKITIETRNAYLDGNYAASHLSVEPGHYVRLSVTDTGCGIDPETQKSIFEPFFTTKEVGKGTGLGLSTVYGIVQQNGGSIWVYSEVNHGTTFKIYLPRIDDLKTGDDREQISKSRHGTETILLVEDEETVRNLASAILEDYGYTVFTAANGAEGLTLCEDSSEKIDLLITDVVMPEMSGRALAEKAERLRPEMRLIYMSGYTDDSVVRHGILAENAAFIQKPFLPDVLASAVREVLDSDWQKLC
ncbi:MAG TPA: ATP-binding protein [Pyrinomonadaceae bacterium]|nr:ATP-binding protein [Pyrinomonadaceae bacterium]